MMTRPPTLLFNLLLASLLGSAPVRSQAAVVDRYGAPLPNATLSMAASLANKDARLSIDAGLQKIVEEELAQDHGGAVIHSEPAAERDNLASQQCWW